MADEAKSVLVSLAEEAAVGTEGGEDAGGQESGKEDVPTATPDVPRPPDPELETPVAPAHVPATEEIADPVAVDQEAGKDEEAGDSAAVQDEDDGEDEIVKERLQMFATGKGQHSWLHFNQFFVMPFSFVMPVFCVHRLLLLAVS